MKMVLFSWLVNKDKNALLTAFKPSETRNNKMRFLAGFTLIELIAVIVVIGILVAIALPQYRIITEKTRAQDGATVLGILRSAQMRFYTVEGSYANSLTDLDIDTPTSIFFTNFTLNYTSWIAKVTRNTNVQYGYSVAYSLYMYPNGEIKCDAGNLDSICSSLGYAIQPASPQLPKEYN